MTHPVLLEIEAWDRNRPRSLQAELGASQLLGCRAAAVLRLNRVDETDGRLRWDALVGTAIHSVCEAAAGPEVMVECRYAYRGVWATIDRYEAPVLTDVKTKKDAAAIRKVQRFGPSRSNKAQVMLGAAALQEAGYPVERVELLYLPRVGKPEDAWVWTAEPDRTLADEAAEWAATVDAIAVDRAFCEPAQMAENLRDEDERFCREYCAYVTACRGAA